MCLIPPQLQEADLAPDERHVVILGHLGDGQVQDLPRIRLEVVDEGLQPPGVIMRVRHHHNLVGEKTNKEGISDGVKLVGSSQLVVRRTIIRSRWNNS